MSKRSFVCGVGINDSNYQTFLKVNLPDGKNKIQVCPFYNAWQHMLQRCYSDKIKEKRPSYYDCSVSEEWHVFSKFKQWMERQPWSGNHLDKDILIPGNRIYSSENCVFISPCVNVFLIDRAAGRGNWPLGVSMDKKTGRFRAQCSNPFTKKLESLGRYDDPDSAHVAWRKRKHELACIYAGMQTDPRVYNALMERYLK